MQKKNNIFISNNNVKIIFLHVQMLYERSFSRDLHYKLHYSLEIFESTITCLLRTMVPVQFKLAWLLITFRVPILPKRLNIDRIDKAYVSDQIQSRLYSLITYLPFEKKDFGKTRVRGIWMNVRSHKEALCDS